VIREIIVVTSKVIGRENTYFLLFAVAIG